MKILFRMKYGLFSAIWVLLALNTLSGQIVLSFTTSQPTCHGFTNGTATVTATGGVEPYTYLWNNNQAGQTTFGLGAGTVSVTVTDQNGQTATGNVAVQQPDPLEVTFTTDGLSCSSNNGTITANPTGGTQPYAYQWSNAAITQTISVSSAGTYFVTVTDANGCAKIGAYNVAPAAEFLPAYTYFPPLCAGQPTGSIDVVVYGTNPGFTWIWETGAENQSLLNVPGGGYGITITDAIGCTYTETVTLNEQAKLIVEVIATDIACSYFPNGGALNSFVVGGTPPYTFVWSNGSNDPNQLNLPAGSYSLTVYDQYGCVATSFDTINIPEVLDGEVISLSPACGDSNGCITVQGVGGTPPYTYIWPALGITGPTACGLGPGTYYVCIFDANGCQHDLEVTMYAIDSLGVNLNLTNALCPGIDNGTVTAIVDPPTGVYNYQWQPQPQPNSPQIDSIAAGTIVFVTVTDVNTGCTGTATDTVGANTEVDLSVNLMGITCPDDLTGSASAVASGGTSPYQYVWTYPDSTTVSGPNIANLGIGTYTITVTDELGCTAKDSVHITALSNPVADYALMLLECEADGITIQFLDKSQDSIVSWNWNISWGMGDTTSTEQNPPPLQFIMDETGTVQLTVTSAFGCTAVIDSVFEIEGAPTATVSVPSVDCENNPVLITVTDGSPNNTYTWMPATGLIFDPDEKNVIADPSETTVYQLVIANGLCTDTLERTVVRVLPINLSVQDTSIVTCDTSATLVALTATSDVVTFVWLDELGNEVGSNANITLIAKGLNTYTVVASDPYGCTETAQASVRGNGVDVSASFTPVSIACDGVSKVFSVTNLDPSDNLTYQWTANDPNVVITPANTPSVTVTGPAGSYTLSVLVKNQYDCELTLTTEVTSLPTISLEGAVAIDLCNGTEVKFSQTVNVPGTWNFGDNNTSEEFNPTHIYAESGVYVVTFSSTENCVLPYDTTIFVLPEIAVVAAIGNNYVSCTNQARIQFTDLTTHFYPIASWNWSFSTGASSNVQNPIITFSDEGTIIANLTVTDVNGCTGTASMPIEIAVVRDSLSSEEPFCPGEAVALNPDFNPNYTYTWVSTPNDPNFDANSPNPNVMPPVPTVYVATIGNGPCVVVDSITVTPEEAAIVSLPDDQIVCSDDLITIKVENTNGVTFVWSQHPDFNPPYPNNTDSLTITPEKNGIYYVQAINEAGCKAIDSIKVNNAAADILADPINRSICEGDSTQLMIINLDPEDILTYEWMPTLPSIPNPTVAPNVSTAYTVKVTNQFGCSDTQQLNVNVISISVTAENIGKDTICPGQSTELLATVVSNSNNITYDWTPSNSLTGEKTANPTASPSETTVYTVTAIAEGLCPDTANVIVYFMPGECAPPYIFVPKAFTPNNDGNNDFFIVRGLDITEVYFVVWDRWGEKVYETRDINARGWDGTFNGKQLTPDSYAWYLQARCGNGEFYTSKGDVTLLK